MSIAAGEVGKLFELGTFFDLSGATLLEIDFIGPGGVTTNIITGRIIAPAVASGDYPANTYMQFPTIATDFPVSGTWKVLGAYDDGTPKEFITKSDPFPTFEILPGKVDFV